MQLTVGTKQVGPQRWAALLYMGDVCVHCHARYHSETAAMAGAKAEIEARAQAVVEAAELARAETARQDAIDLVCALGTGSISPGEASVTARLLWPYLRPTAEQQTALAA